MNNFRTPGVFVQEISTLPASVAPVETAIPAFIGYTELQPAGSLNTPVRITSMLDYIEAFGGANNELFNIEILDSLDSAGVETVREINVTLDNPSNYRLYQSLQMFFNNGGGPCYIVSVGLYSAGTITADDMKLGIKGLEKADEPTLLLFPDAFLGLRDDANKTAARAAYGGVMQTALAHCQKMQDRFLIADTFLSGEPSDDEVELFRTSLGTNALNYGAAYHPALNSSLNYGFSASLTVNHTIGSGVITQDLGGIILSSDDALDTNTLAKKNPSVYRTVLAGIRNVFVQIPPSGAIAGVYARVDSDRGVWKAPANVSINNVISPSELITADEQALLNVDPTAGKSINAIRNFAGKGTLVWGARTLAGNDNEWRYVPVRRLFIFIEESIKKATEFVVFEPNDANTWLRTKTMIENFLVGLWREGALAGAAPQDAFFVNIGLGVTMTSQDILEGRMNVEIGLAAVRPAEFIILKFSHKLQES